MQAPARLTLCSFLVISDLDFGHSGAPFEWQHRDVLPVMDHEIGNHMMPIKEFHLNNWLRVSRLPQKFINSNSGTLAIGHAINNQTRTEDAIASGKDPGSTRH